MTGDDEWYRSRAGGYRPVLVDGLLALVPALLGLVLLYCPLFR